MCGLADVGEHIASRRVLELRGDPVDDHHVVALVHEEVDQVGADEARAARDEDPHGACTPTGTPAPARVVVANLTARR